jgi:hypothetical protein
MNASMMLVVTTSVVVLPRGFRIVSIDGGMRLSCTEERLKSYLLDGEKVFLWVERRGQ